MTLTSMDRFAYASARTRTSPTMQLSPMRYLRFLSATLAASLQVARAYEQADTDAARRNALDRFTLHLRA